MTQFPDKSSKPALLPDPRLNPLMNPTLAQNLGRWAQVYFTNPPEKRESAVVELLRELEGELPGGGSGAVPRNTAPAVHQAVKATQERPMVECPGCRRQNPDIQAFCGGCGAHLHPENKTGRTEPALPTVPPENELQWLRERVPGSAEAAPGHAWRYAVAAFTIVLALIAYLEWAPSSVTAPAPVSTASAPAAAAQPQTGQTIAPVQSQERAAPAQPGQPQQPVVEAVVAQSEKVKQKPVEALLTSPSPSPAGGLEDAATSTKAGGQELKEAQRILRAVGPSSDPAEAARWLWKAVGKQNTDASVLLADLYRRGVGVPQNCEQARMLLMAAARKNDIAAGEKLRDLETNGCP